LAHSQQQLAAAVAVLLTALHRHLVVLAAVLVVRLQEYMQGQQAQQVKVMLVVQTEHRLRHFLPQAAAVLEPLVVLVLAVNRAQAVQVFLLL
jgi:Na+/H+ antiporter NhaC